MKPASILRFARRGPGPLVATIKLAFGPEGPETSRLPTPAEQAAAAIAWLDVQYDIVCREPGWEALTPAKQVERLRLRMDARAFELNLDSLSRQAWARLLPELEQRAMARALAETHRMMRDVSPASEKL